MSKYELDYAKHYANYEHAHEADWRRVPTIAPTTPGLLGHCTAHYAERELIVFDDERMTYGELNRQSANLARQLLAAGVGKGSRIGMMFPNGPQFLVAWFAITRMGATAVPISTLSSEGELQRILRHSDIQIFITVDRYLNHDYVARFEAALPGLKEQRAPIRLLSVPYLREMWVWGANVPAWAKAVDVEQAPADYDAELLAAIEAEVAPSDAVSIIYTSGSTAEPKGVIHSHGNFLRQGGKLCGMKYPPFEPGDRIFTQMPFFWVGGLTMTLLNLMHLGATYIGSAKVGAELLDLLQKEEVTMALGWPHLMKALALDPSFKGREFPKLRGGTFFDAIPPALRPKDPSLFTIALGMTETCGPHSFADREIPPSERGSFGKVNPGMQYRVIDPETGKPLGDAERGELLVRGDTLMIGMVKRERHQIVDVDGWYHTGDDVTIRDGSLYFHGRLDDMIKTAGANVAPPEVEATLNKFPGVAQAFVFSVPDQKRVAVVGAIVVHKPGASVDVGELLKFAATDLSSYKVPKVVLVVPPGGVPMTSSGKVDRLRVRKLLQDQHEAAGG